jgi:hypothetical protein
VTADDPGHCAICAICFIDTDADEDEAITLCPRCDRVSHVVCNEAHACPCQGPTDQEKLKAWELACADGREA